MCYGRIPENCQFIEVLGILGILGRLGRFPIGKMLKVFYPIPLFYTERY
jgi:hypothetical protein